MISMSTHLSKVSKVLALWEKSPFIFWHIDKWYLIHIYGKENYCLRMCSEAKLKALSRLFLAPYLALAVKHTFCWVLGPAAGPNPQMFIFLRYRKWSEISLWPGLSIFLSVGWSVCLPVKIFLRGWEISLLCWLLSEHLFYRSSLVIDTFS